MAFGSEETEYLRLTTVVNAVEGTVEQYFLPWLDTNRFFQVLEYVLSESLLEDI
jgi:hypothetical protein